MSRRRWSVLAVTVGTLGLVLVAFWQVPWHPVPGGMPAPADPRSVFTPAQLARAHAFSDPARVLGWSSLAVSLVAAAVLGFTSLGARLVARLPGAWWLRTIQAVVVLAVIGRLVTLPFAVVGHRRAVRFGLTHQPWGAWAVDEAKSLVLSVVVSALVVLLVVLLGRRLPRAWPMAAGLALGALVMVGSFVYPVLVEPAFNHFSSLPDGRLRTQILRLAAAEHVRLDDVLVADASRRTTTLNAYVSGFGDTRRVVLYDTVLDDLSRRQVLTIVSHELGHAKYDDVLTGSVLGGFGALAGAGLLGLVLPVVRRDERAAADPAAVPALLALMAVATVLTSPLQNAVSRQIETRADVVGLQTTHDVPAFVTVQRQLALHALSDEPPAWSQLWFGSHPTTLERIAIARQLGARS